MSEQLQPDSIQSRIDGIAKEAEQIYKEQYKERFEQEYLGRYVVINTKNGEASVHEFSEEALLEARKKDPHGVFHLMRIGPSPTLSLVR